MSTDAKKLKIQMQGRWIEATEEEYREWLKHIRDEPVREAQRRRLEYDQGIKSYTTNALRLI